MGAEPERPVIVCGLGELGVRVVEALRAAGVPVVVVDDTGDARQVDAVRQWGASVLVGDPRRREVLEAAGLATARSVVSVQGADLRNLETALAVRGLLSDARIVVQVANAAVGAAVGDLLHAGAALDVATLAAPTLVQACLGGDRVDVVLDGERFAVTEVVVDRAGTLRAHLGDRVPIGAVDPDGRTTLCPGRDVEVVAGTRVTVVEPAAELAAATARAAPSRPGGAPGLRRLVAGVGALRGGAGRRTAVVLGAIVALVAASTTVLHVAYRPRQGGHLSLLDAAYFTVETVSTVGFGDFSYAGQAPWLVVFGIAVIILGAAAVASLFALLTDLLLSRRVADALGQRRLTRLSGHVVVIGFGAVGVRVVEELQRIGRPVVVIDRDGENRHLRVARSLGVPVVAGDATSVATMREANVAAAAAVAVLTSDDLTNLETALSLRRYLDTEGVDIPVPLRVFDRDLGRTIEQAFGFRAVRSPSAIAALWFVGAALGLDVVSTVAVDQEVLLVARLTVAPAGGLAGVTMQELSARIRVLAIRRVGSGDLEHPPRRSTRFEPGDQAYLVGPYDELLSVLERDAARAP